jgi:hypothetical protein
MSIDNVTIHQGYELPNGTNTLAHDVTRLINALTSVDSDVFLRPLASSSTYVGTTAIALNRASAAQALTGITSIDGSAATLTTSRTLWGQSFNGSANVTGNLTSVGNITGSGAISLTTAAASNLSLTSGTTGAVSLDSGTTGAVNIGTGANTKTITIGSSTGTVQLPTAVTKVGQTSLIQGGAVNVTFPTLAGTLVGSGDTGTVTATMLASTTGTGSTVVLSTLPTFGTTGVKFSGSTSGTTTLLASATASGTLTLPAVTGTVVTTGDTGSVTSTMILNGTVLDADVNAGAAIAGTKISPDFGSQNVTTTGTSTAARFIPSSATVPTNGLYLSAANTVALATNSAGRVFIDSSGNLSIGVNSALSILTVKSAVNTWAASFGADIGQNDYTGISLGFGPGSPYHKGAIGFIRTDATNGAGDIVFCLGSTSNATNVVIGNEKARITSTGTLNIVGAGTAGSTQAVSFNGSAPVNSLVLDSSGRLLVGTSTSRSNWYNTTGLDDNLQIEGTTHGGSGFSIVRSNNFGGHIELGAHGGTTIGSYALVSSGANFGNISFQGADGTEFVEAANISTAADGTPGANNMPGRLVFSTTASGSATPTERMRITSAGLVGIGLTPTYQLQLSTDSAAKPSTALWTITSDERIKEDIELADLDLCYEAVKTIPLKRYKWRDEVYSEEQVTDRRKLGWIAQDVETVFPKAVSIYEFKYNQVFKETIIPAVEEEVDDEGNIVTSAQPERKERGELISEDVIKDCRDLNADQIYAAMYGAIQKLITKVETLETEVKQFKA